MKTGGNSFLRELSVWMLPMYLVAAAVMAVVVSSAPPGSCPSVCSCSLDISGRRQVICTKGELMDPLPVIDMPSDMEVLIVGAPPGMKNSLTLGPIFKGHRRLEKLSVTRSQVPALGAHSFWGLRRLHTLNVSHNSISAIIDTNFRGTDNLHTLDLSHNHVESVPSAVFRHVRNLVYLSLANNRLPEVVPRMLYGLSKLEVLDISNNPLGDLPPSHFTDAPNIRELRCSACGLQTVSADFLKTVPELRSLDLRYNRLTEVPPVKVLSHLTTLHLDNNHISSIASGSLSGAPLETITLAYNRISSLKSRSLSNTSLTHLDLAYNRITKLRSESLNGVYSSLEYLRLSGNPLPVDSMLNAIPRTRQLRHLEIGELGLTQMPGSLLRQSRHLKILNVSGNYLSAFPASSLFATPHLTVLDLSHNNFRGLKQELVTAFKTMASLEKVYLEGNPWQCEQCQIGPMLDWLSDPSASMHPHASSVCHNLPASPRCLKCAGPPSMTGRELQLLEMSQVPDCEPISPVWPAWLGGPQSDDPRSPRDQHTTEAIQEMPESLSVFFGDHMALIIGVGCGLVLALLLVVVAALLLARRHTALYYTQEPEDNDSSQKLMSRNNNDNSPPGPRSLPRTPTPYTPRNGATIATIEEVDSIAGSNADLKNSRDSRELRAPRIVRLAASPLP